ncbi:MAG: hypothetical protein LBV54_06950, partial [Puniceicoccales bacterium]|nr:hypothetical protein [Puniceicoccales bacterium]
THYLPRKLLLVAFSVGATLILLTWLFLVLPFEIKAFSIGVRIAILLAIVAIIAVFLRRLISWHNAWRETVGEVLSSGGEDSHMETREETRRALDSGLESWEIYLEECVVPDNATCVGESLQKLAIPSRFGGAIVEIERNGHSTLTPGPDMRLYPGDKVLLLGKRTEIEQARAFLESKNTKGQSGMLNHAVLETYAVQKGPRTGKTLAELGITRNTGVRVVGIQREGQRIINPTGQDVLLDGDGLLLMGTIEQIRLFAQWLVNSGAEKS